MASELNLTNGAHNGRSCIVHLALLWPGSCWDLHIGVLHFALQLFGHHLLQVSNPMLCIRAAHLDLRKRIQLPFARPKPSLRHRLPIFLCSKHRAVVAVPLRVGDIPGALLRGTGGVAVLRVLLPPVPADLQGAAGRGAKRAGAEGAREC